MNEAAAREVLLVRAVETSDGSGGLWHDEDRAWASRAAAEVTGAAAAPEVFLARRAALALERLKSRHPAFLRALKGVAWRSWIGPALAVAAFGLGLAADQLGPARRVNILALPLLGLLAWNLAAYLLLAGRTVARLLPGGKAAPAPLARAVARLGRGLPRGAAPADADVAPAVAAFLAAWSRLAAPLLAHRVAAVLHAGAFAFALGAVAGMYGRGLLFAYQAGWESTFLDAGTVHAVLARLLAPASALTGIAVPGVAQLEAMAAGAAVSAAPWIHLHAANVALVVLVPRLLLALGHGLRARRLAARFPLALDDPYYRRLTRQLGRETARVRIIPYSYQLAPQAVIGLQAIAARVFGPRTEVSIAPAVPWGSEDALADDLLPPSPPALVAVVFSLAATPESEHHGAFLAAVAARAGAPVAVLLDESAFRRRFGHDAGRLAQRRSAWRELLAAGGSEPVFVDLEAPDAAALEEAVERGLQREVRA